MGSDGSRPRRVLRHAGEDSAPAWSPDGGWIAFGSNRDGRQFDVFVVRPNGSELRRVTRRGGGQPSWSPDGRRIAFVRVAGGDPQGFGTPGAEIWVMNADGRGQTQLTHNDVGEGAPAWSPDGTRIAFTRTVPGPAGDQGAELWTMTPDGSDERRLTAGDGFDESPKWSPNGRRIMFTRLVEERRLEVFTIRPDGSDVRRIASRPSPQGFDAVWSPDSRRVLLTDGNAITIARADGTGARRLVKGVAFVDWQAR